MTRPILALVVLLSASCSGGDRARQAETTTNADTATAAAPSRMKVVDSLKGPESARYDADLDVWFVSNINGTPLDRDNNGFITRLTADGTIDSLAFIAAGRNGVTLHAPKGIAIVGDTLWVTDIDAVRAFNKRTGATIATVNLAGQAKFLNDAAVGPDGIYVTDSETHRIYRIGPGRKATVALQSDSLAGPNGIAWDSAGRRFVVVAFGGNNFFTWAPGDTAPRRIGSGAGQFDGVEIMPNGDLLITSWADSSLSVFRGGELVRLAGNIASPADIGVDWRRGRVAVPQLMEDRVEIWTIPITESAAARAIVEPHGEWVYIKKGADSIRAYIAYPERKTKAPGVIVIHEIFGLTKWEPTVADRLARSGFVAIVPDLLSSKYGTTPSDADSGRALIAQLEPDRITTDLDATYAYLNRLPAVHPDRIATIGFCWGGGQSFRYTTNNPKLRAAVVCYGPAPDTGAMKRIRAPILGIYGENDARINASLPEVTAAMKADGKDFTTEVYPGTGHGFLKPGRQGFETPQPERAWKRINEFLRARLGS